MNRLLDDAPHPDEVLDELQAAFTASQAARLRNSRDGGLVVAATHRLLRSWPKTAGWLGEAETTLRRWARPYRGGA